jgi:hypothetical protein
MFQSQAKARRSFLKKRTKKLLFLGCVPCGNAGGLPAHLKARFFAFLGALQEVFSFKLGGLRRPGHIWAVSSAVERLVYTERVGGSNPSPPIPAASCSRFLMRLRHPWCKGSICRVMRLTLGAKPFTPPPTEMRV